MRVNDDTPMEHEITLRLSREEMRLLGNSLNEVINGMHLAEFNTRLGSDRDFANKLHERMIAIYRHRWPE